MTTYYTVSAVPSAHSFGSSAYIRTEYTLIQTAFGTVNSEMVLKGAIAGQAWTGAHTFTGGSITMPTQSLGNNTTYGASTAFVYAGLALKADLASPALTGTPTAPTATVGTATNQIATTSFVASTSFTAALPGQVGNAGKVLLTDGTNPSWGAVVGATLNLYNFGGL